MRLIIELTLAERILNSLLFYIKDQNWVEFITKKIINHASYSSLFQEQNARAFIILIISATKLIKHIYILVLYPIIQK
jgi:hypothetical protein